MDESIERLLPDSKLEFNSESSQTHDFQINIHNLKGQRGGRADKFACCAIGKGA